MYLINEFIGTREPSKRTQQIQLLLCKNLEKAKKLARSRERGGVFFILTLWRGMVSTTKTGYSDSKMLPLESRPLTVTTFGKLPAHLPDITYFIDI